MSQADATKDELHRAFQQLDADDIPSSKCIESDKGGSWEGWLMYGRLGEVTLTHYCVPRMSLERASLAVSCSLASHAVMSSPWAWKTMYSISVVHRVVFNICDQKSLVAAMESPGFFEQLLMRNLVTRMINLVFKYHRDHQ